MSVHRLTGYSLTLSAYDPTTLEKKLNKLG